MESELILFIGFTVNNSTVNVIPKTKIKMQKKIIFSRRLCGHVGYVVEGINHTFQTNRHLQTNDIRFFLRMT